MTLLSRDQILEASDLPTIVVTVPEWGGDVTIRSMTGVDRDAFENAMVTVDADGKREPDMKNMRAKLAAVTIVDADGNLMFSVDDVERLALKSSAALERVFLAAQKLNSLGAAGEDAAVKNS